jgi:hypothetical protein
MVTANPLEPAFYAPLNQLALALHRERLQALADRRYDEASEAALAGNPHRARYVEYWARRVEA